MTFDIMVFEEDELPNGELGIKQHIENGVQASSRKELIALYAMSGSKIKILREYGGVKPTGPIDVSPTNVISSQVTAAPVPNMPAQQQAATQVTVPVAVAPSAPQFYKIGDVEIKIENGVSYQKQFMQLTDAEASNIRVVDDKTNRTVNLKGKHIEMKRWVKVETNSNDDTAALEESFS